MCLGKSKMRRFGGFEQGSGVCVCEDEEEEARVSSYKWGDAPVYPEVRAPLSSWDWLCPGTLRQLWGPAAVLGLGQGLSPLPEPTGAQGRFGGSDVLWVDQWAASLAFRRAFSPLYCYIFPFAMAK